MCCDNHLCCGKPFGMSTADKLTWQTMSSQTILKPRAKIFNFFVTTCSDKQQEVQGKKYVEGNCFFSLKDQRKKFILDNVSFWVKERIEEFWNIHNNRGIYIHK